MKKRLGQLLAKYWDEETGLVYYGYRYYSPNFGRFINRDPIEESGGLNLYAFVTNNPINTWEYMGHGPIPMGDDAGATGQCMGLGGAIAPCPVDSNDDKPSSNDEAKQPATTTDSPTKAADSPDYNPNGYQTGGTTETGKYEVTWHNDPSFGAQGTNPATDSSLYDTLPGVSSESGSGSGGSGGGNNPQPGQPPEPNKPNCTPTFSGTDDSPISYGDAGWGDSEVSGPSGTTASYMVGTGLTIRAATSEVATGSALTTVAAGVATVGLLATSGDSRQDPNLVSFRRYDYASAAPLYSTVGRNIGETYAAPLSDPLVSSSEAQALYALPGAPRDAYYIITINPEENPYFGPTRVTPNFGQPGGGNEVKIIGPIKPWRIKGPFPLPKDSKNASCSSAK